MSTASATTPSAPADQKTVPELINDVVAKFEEIKDRLEEADQKTKDLANIDYLRVQDLQACIEAHPGKWSDDIKGYFGNLMTEYDNGLKNPSIKTTYVDFIRVSAAEYRKFAEETLEKEAKEWLEKRREDGNRTDSDEDLFVTSMSGLPTTRILGAFGR